MHTFGCKVNQYDSEALAHLFREHSHQIVEDGADADIVIVNTCAVTGESERKARQYLRKIAKEYPMAGLVVTGCYGQTSPGELEELDGVKLVTGVKNRHRLVEQVEQVFEPGTPSVRVEDWSSREAMQWNAADFPSRTRAFLKIEDGCSAQCSYCKVPLARGPVRSLPVPEVVSEFKRLVELGHKEIVLTGIHLGCYGRDLGIGLDEVILRVDMLAGEYRFRLGSVEPNDFTPMLIDSMAKAGRLCPHLHIPLQSGSESVLRRMNRNYSPRDYADLIAHLRLLIPDLAVTTDVIVGFPGESDLEFRETMAFIEGLKFSDLHVFPFSRRSGTAAYAMSDQIPRSIRQERVGELIRLGDRLAANYRDGFVGQRVQVLIEELNAEGGEGFTEHYLRTQVNGVGEAGVLVSAVVTEDSGEKLVACLLK